ncbi:terminase family protein [Limnohabitans sp. WS1]|uniref:terminase large subunit domain-containing protein n=1 Tax=Limnohabitans sp. WS1 TaxID=1100726 RepID=UPI000D3A237A|nr:terminase family protein [Limnohabitans sp. WS1]PUE20367.1 terminase [Limnohabitans sp. WS1]
MSHTEPQTDPDAATAIAAAGALPAPLADKAEAAGLPSPEPKRQARFLYWSGWRITHIAELLGVPRTTVHDWRASEKWDDAQAIDRVEGALEARLVLLIQKDGKTGGDFKEIDLLMRQVAQTARVQKYQETGKEGDLNPNIAARNAGPKKKPKRNEFAPEHVDALTQAFRDSLFDYQKVWSDAANQRTRMILKSRQIGATWYFAREAMVDAITTGRNQIFLSASKAQAHVFKQYIQAFAGEVCQIELSGDPITLGNGAILYFLGTNAKTAQGYHGNFYFDEFFWTHGFTELNKVASGMALHKKWRRTYFSTPSSIQHEAHDLWSGARYNKRRAKEDQIELDLSHSALAPGLVGGDKIWRNLINIYDALAGGCDLFDIDELKTEYNPEEFANLLMCEFMDDTHAVFPLSAMQRCMVDSWVVWDDFKPFARKPFGLRPVLIGYDPSQSEDFAGCAVVAPPDTKGGKFRVLEQHQLHGDFEAQAQFIKDLTLKYNVIYVGIDTTGIGEAVHQLVKNFFPGVTTFKYAIDVKTMLVAKAKNVIEKGRLEFDAGAKEIARAFMSIKKTLTDSGRQMTYTAGRNKTTGHADLAWAVMHALAYEPLDANNKTRSIVEYT